MPDASCPVLTALQVVENQRETRQRQKAILLKPLESGRSLRSRQALWAGSQPSRCALSGPQRSAASSHGQEHLLSPRPVHGWPRPPGAGGLLHPGGQSQRPPMLLLTGLQPTVSGSHAPAACPGLGPILVPAYPATVFLLLADSSLPPEKLQFYLAPELVPSTWRMPEISPQCVSISILLNSEVSHITSTYPLIPRNSCFSLPTQQTLIHERSDFMPDACSAADRWSSLPYPCHSNSGRAGLPSARSCHGDHSHPPLQTHRSAHCTRRPPFPPVP